MPYFIDTNSFETATNLWIDQTLDTVAPDGYYSIDGISRQMVSGVLQNAAPCTECVTTTTTTTTTTSDCGCNRYTIFVSQSDIDDATGNTNLDLDRTLVVTYNDCLGVQRQISLADAGFWTNVICIDESTIIYLTYWKNDTERQAITSYTVDTFIKCCVDATTTTTTTTAAPTTTTTTSTTSTTTIAPTTTTTTTTLGYSVLTLFLETMTGLGFESPINTCYSGSPFSVFINDPFYTDFQTAYNDGKILWTSPSFTSVLNGQNRWYRDTQGNAIQVGTDGFIIAIVPFAAVGCAGTTTTTSTTTTTTLPPATCGESFSFTGSQSYPYIREIDLASDTGIVAVSFAPVSVPDRAILRWNSSVVIDTGYVGNAVYDFGESSRESFINSLTGKTDPITSNVYPDFTTYPDDGYPRVTAVMSPYTFDKNLASPSIANLEVYGPMPNTIWSISVGCPGATTTSTTTTTTAEPTTTTTTSTTTTTTAAPTTTTTTSTTTTTTLAPGVCNEQTSYNGGPGFPTSQQIFLGSDTGDVTLSFTPRSIPDRAIVVIGGSNIIDTGFVGLGSFDFGGSSRNTFKSWMVGRIDPVTLIAYPDFTNFPDDGYPRVSSPAQPSITVGTKSTPDTFATVEIYGPSPNTIWDYTLSCVGEGPVTTTSTTTTTTSSPETFRYGRLTRSGGIVSIPNSSEITILSGTLGGDPDGSINIPFASGVDDFIWFAIPSSKPTKTAWFVSALNQGDIGGTVSQFGNLFPDPVLKTEGGTEFKLYISNYRTAVASMIIS